MGNVNLRIMKTLAVMVFIIFLVVGLVLIHDWASTAHENFIDASNDADRDFWQAEYEKRGDYGAWFILVSTVVAAVIFASGIFERLADEEEEEPLEAVSPSYDG